MTLNQRAQGSNPCRPTNQSGAYKVKIVSAFFFDTRIDKLNLRFCRFR